ncbi:POK19 protein, partial [Syrrhaptes paradoxus]|nr:POK19 protein [Syrrhaptes paradoxus]
DLLVVDLRDCFFTIPLHPSDCEKFAFSVPTINRAAPMKRYHWVVLPQGMKNSPTICQWYVDLALQPFRSQHQNFIVYHYMDDLLIAAELLNTEETVKELTH